MAVDNSKRIIHGHFLDERSVDHLSAHALKWTQASVYQINNFLQFHIFFENRVGSHIEDWPVPPRRSRES
jgi:hypothetical protein